MGNWLFESLFSESLEWLLQSKQKPDPELYRERSSSVGSASGSASLVREREEYGEGQRNALVFCTDGISLSEGLAATNTAAAAAQQQRPPPRENFPTPHASSTSLPSNIGIANALEALMQADEDGCLAWASTDVVARFGASPTPAEQVSFSQAAAKDGLSEFYSRRPPPSPRTQTHRQRQQAPSFQRWPGPSTREESMEEADTFDQNIVDEDFVIVRFSNKISVFHFIGQVKRKIDDKLKNCCSCLPIVVTSDENGVGGPTKRYRGCIRK
ncbi:Protein of unknown function [Gryllus bimaculatus]|nr:Protein of unknown function [Gryllus bimaculatus]